MATVTEDILAQLSPQQQGIYRGLAEGKSPDTIAREMGTLVGLVNANITQIRNKNIPIPTGRVENATPPDEFKAHQILTNPRPAAHGGSENDRIVNTVSDSAPAINAEKLRALADQVAGQTGRDIQPMVLLGVTIQFVKFCGGRFTAHQLIEDVYGALRAFAQETAGMKLPEDNGGEAMPLPSSDRERLELAEKTNRELMARVAQLEAKLRERQPSSEYRE